MPVKIPRALPATRILNDENIFVMDESRASAQDIRPLRVLILNLMPTKIVTETQLLRLIGNTPLQVEVVLLRTKTHKSRNTSQKHLSEFYQTFDQIKDRKFDGMIITGAPVERLPFEEIHYWDELVTIMEWSKAHVFSTMHICWAANAGLYYHYGVPKKLLKEKLFGVFPHKILNINAQLLRGFDDVFYSPHSRFSTVDKKDILTCPELELLTHSKQAGVHLVTSLNRKHVFVTGHLEYDRETLAKEYRRDVDLGLSPNLPFNYFPEDNPAKRPNVTWRAHANLLFSNWLNYYVYQDTPYNIDEI